MSEKSCIYPEAMGHGYGINKDVPGDRKLVVSVPAYKGVSRNPGDSTLGKKGVGRQGLPYFQGASNKKHN